MTLKLFLSATAIFFICLFVSWYSTTQLRRKHGSDIRVVWYFFALSLVATFGIAWQAADIGAINEHGAFQGSLGEIIKKLLDFMLNINADLKILIGIVLLIVLPQIISYVLSGLAGCATTPLLIEGSLRFLIWGLVKSFVVCAGIILSLAVFGMWKGWDAWWPGALALLYTSALLVMLSFAVLLMYRETEAVTSDIRKHFPKFVKPFDAIHRCFTRHES